MPKKIKKEYWHSQRFVIDVNIFNVDVGFAINSTEQEIKTWLQKLSGKKYKDFDEKELKGWDNSETDLGRMINFEGGFVVLLKLEKNKFRYSIGILAHEINHVVNYLLMDRRISLSKDNDEVYAYLTEYITREALLKMY